jgi:hypothetical protein
MSLKTTIHSHYHINLEDEIIRTEKQLETLGIHGVTKMETTAFIAEKNKQAKIPVSEVRDFFSRFRGLK